jgi:hypothetical protein
VKPRWLRSSRGLLLALSVFAVMSSACAASRYHQVSCEASPQSIFLLEAQAVPSATLIPCITWMPLGWSYGGSDVSSRVARFWLNSDRVGTHAVEVALTGSCDLSRAQETSLENNPANLRLFEEPIAEEHGATVRHYAFEGGCVTYRFRFTRRSMPTIFQEADHFLGFTPRSVYVDGVREDEGLTLCGAGAPPCPG